jgi:hypothetical protein
MVINWKCVKILRIRTYSLLIGLGDSAVFSWVGCHTERSELLRQDTGVGAKWFLPMTFADDYVMDFVPCWKCLHRRIMSVKYYVISTHLGKSPFLTIQL